MVGWVSIHLPKPTKEDKVGDILLSMFPGSLTVCETNPDGTMTTHTHFLADAWLPKIGEEEILCWGLLSYTGFLPPYRDYHANP